MPRIFKVGGYLVYFWSNENWSSIISLAQNCRVL